uniref:Uncharacterized protein n=1 Tax=Amphimedon queenslandica TaxID=400682 RepID=A0A1X7UPM9_AMPQE
MIASIVLNISFLYGRTVMKTSATIILKTISSASKTFAS